MPNMKTITIGKRNRFRTLHVEAPGCIVNIHFGLTNEAGHAVTNISVTADDYVGGPSWYIEGPTGLQEHHNSIRVIEKD